MTIELSPASQELITQLSATDPTLFQQTFTNLTNIDRKALLVWLKSTEKIESKHKAFFLIISLRGSLLKDFHRSLNPGAVQEEKEKGKLSARIKLGILAALGTVFFGCEGFDGITAILGIFSLPTVVLFAVGTLFSLLSIIVFYSFDLVEISKNLGVKVTDTPKLVDALLDEVKQIEAIRMRLAKTVKKSKKELEEDLEVATMLLQRYKNLKQIRDDLTSAANNPYLQAAKYITAGVAGILFFSGGFFAGQTVALAIAGLFVTTTLTATAWPIVVAGIAVGLAALSVYWFVERPGIENLISRWRGLDKKKMDKLCKEDVVKKETEELEELVASIDYKINSLKQLEENQLEIKSIKEKLSALEAEKNAALLKAETAELEAARLSAELEKIKGQQTIPTVETAQHDDPIISDTIVATRPIHIARDDNGPPPRQHHAFFRSASTGHLLDLGKGSTLDINSM